MLLRFTAVMVLLVTMVSGAGTVCGQTYPTKVVRIFTAGVGGGSDFIARLIAQGISGPLGQQVIVENRTGVIPGEIVSQAAPDGHTIILAAGTLWIGPLLRKTSYDPIRDFLPITLACRAPNVVVVHPALPVRSINELIAMAKQLGVKALEFHTGRFALEIAAARSSQDKAKALEPLQLAAWTASQHDLQVHVGHGLHYTNVHFLKQIPSIEEANIGHAIITRALYVGLKDAVSQMREALGRGPA